MPTIQLTKGQVAIVDEVDAERVAALKWQAQTRRYVRKDGTEVVRYYAVGTVSGKRVGMHAFIMSPPAGTEVDHRNRDSLDNRRENLRVGTHSMNSANRVFACHSGKLRGVHRHGRKFYAFLTVAGQPRVGSGFSTAEEAAREYDRRAKEAFGEFAVLNFPETAAAK